MFLCAEKQKSKKKVGEAGQDLGASPPFSGLRMRGVMNCYKGVQGFSGPLSQKSDENPRMRVIPHSKFSPKCAHAPFLVAFFVTTDLKNPVQRFAGWLSQICDENSRMRGIFN